MFKLLKNSKGQGMTVQYTLTFFFIVSVVTGMTVYFKRTIQGRIADATVYMARTVHNVYSGNVYSQYEPYYLVSRADRTVTTDQVKQLLPSFNTTSGIFVGSDATATGTAVFSNQLPPGLAK